MGVSVQQSGGVGERARPASLEDLAGFRRVFYDCRALRADALFELTDAVLCAEGPVATLVGLALTAEHRRGHSATGCAGRWRAGPCPGTGTAGSPWRWISARGCARMRLPARIGAFVTSTGAAGADDSMTRRAHLLADLPVELLGRIRSDRVSCSPPPPRTPTTPARPNTGESSLPRAVDECFRGCVAA